MFFYQWAMRIPVAVELSGYFKLIVESWIKRVTNLNLEDVGSDKLCRWVEYLLFKTDLSLANIQTFMAIMTKVGITRMVN